MSSTDSGKSIRKPEHGLVPNANPDVDETKHIDDIEKDHKLVLTDDEALERARRNPQDTTPIYIVYSDNDKDNPRNWPKWKRWYITLFVNSLNILTCWSAGAISSGSTQIEEEFGVSSEIAVLSLSLYVLGFAFGPMLLAPLSEYFGRKPVYIVSWGLLFIFQLPIALAPNIGTILVCRFIGGFVGSPPLTNTGGTISDLWTRNESGGPMAVYGISSTFGPPSALMISGYIAQNLGWRYIFWTLFGIFGGFWIILIVTVPETRHTKILEQKAKRVRKILAKEGIAEADHIRDVDADEKTGFMGLIKVNLTRPFVFLFTEPITMFAAAYNGFLYGLVYLFNEAFPLVFGPGGHGFGVGAQGLSFTGLAVGPLIAFCFYPLQERHYLREVKKNNGKGVPEARVWMARLGAFFIPVSLFWWVNSR